MIETDNGTGLGDHLLIQLRRSARFLAALERKYRPSRENLAYSRGILHGQLIVAQHYLPYNKDLFLSVSNEIDFLLGDYLK